MLVHTILINSLKRIFFLLFFKAHLMSMLELSIMMIINSEHYNGI